jgi:type VII secretion protein EccE
MVLDHPDPDHADPPSSPGILPSANFAEPLILYQNREEAANLTMVDARVRAENADGARAHRFESALSAFGSRMPAMGFARVAVWEGAAVAIPLSFHSVGLQARVAIALSATLVIAATSIRFAGRHLFGWTLTWITYRLLQHDDRRVTADAVQVLVHDLRLRQHVDRAGNRFGIAGVGDSWTAVVAVTGKPELAPLLDVLRQAVDDADVPLAGAQLTIRSGAGEQVCLLSLRYRPADAPLAALCRGKGELGELRATTRAALNVMGTLAELGHHSTMLEAGELAAELRAYLGVPESSARPLAALDAWRSWSVGGTAQSCFVPLTKTDLPAVLGSRAQAAAFTVTSYTLRRTSFGRIRDEATIRAGGPPGTRKPPRARDLDVPAVPLYGRHAAAVRRTLPLALPS